MKKFSQKDYDDFVKNEDSLDLKLYLRPIFKRFKLIKKIILIFFLIFLFIAFLTPKEYKSSVVFIPQNSSNSSSTSGLGSLAMMAGINLNTLSSDKIISEDHYPMILSSNSFKKQLLKELKDYKKEVTSSKKASRKFLVELGVVDSVVLAELDAELLGVQNDVRRHGQDVAVTFDLV